MLNWAVSQRTTVNLVLLLPFVKLGHLQGQLRDKPTNTKVLTLTTLCEAGPNLRDKTTNTKVLILHCMKLGQTTETRQWTPRSHYCLLLNSTKQSRQDNGHPRTTSGVLSPTRLSLGVEDGSRRTLVAALDDAFRTLVKHVTAARLVGVPSIMATIAGRLIAAVCFGDVQQVLASSSLGREDGFFLRTVQLVQRSLVFAHQMARRPFAARVWLQAVTQTHAVSVT